MREETHRVRLAGEQDLQIVGRNFIQPVRPHFQDFEDAAIRGFFGFRQAACARDGLHGVAVCGPGSGVDRKQPLDERPAHPPLFRGQVQVLHRHRVDQFIRLVHQIIREPITREQPQHAQGGLQTRRGSDQHLQADVIEQVVQDGEHGLWIALVDGVDDDEDGLARGRIARPRGGSEQIESRLAHAARGKERNALGFDGVAAEQALR